MLARAAQSSVSGRRHASPSGRDIWGLTWASPAYLGISHVVFRAFHRCWLNVPGQPNRSRNSFIYVSAIFGDMHISAVLHALNRVGKGVGARQFWSFRTGRRYAGVFWYNHTHAAHGSSQVGKAALVGWHAMDVMITDGCTSCTGLVVIFCKSCFGQCCIRHFRGL